MVRVNISIEGLGIVCFNKDAKPKRGEIALLNHEHHSLTLKAETRDGQIIREETLSPDTRITFVNDKPATKYKLNDDEDFDRDNGLANDLYDLRWILDLEGDELHDEELRPAGHRPHLTRIYIPDAFFYTDKLSKRECYKIKPNGDKAPLGWVGEALGATIIAERVTLEISGKPPLTLSDNLEYRVSVKNVREPHTLDPSSDFRMYYHILKDKDGDQFDIQLESVLHFPELICAVARWGETGTIDEL